MTPPPHHSVISADPAGFEAETAGLAALANLRAEGPATARELLRRIERAAEVAGEAALPFKHATLYAVLHELAFDAFIVVTGATLGDRKVYKIAPRGRVSLAQGQERWRSAHLVIKAAATTGENLRS